MNNSIEIIYVWLYAIGFTLIMHVEIVKITLKFSTGACTCNGYFYYLSLLCLLSYMHLKMFNTCVQKRLTL